MVNCHINSLEG